MTFNYVARRKKASDLISRFGLTAILSQDGEMIGPAWAAMPGDPNEIPVTLVVTDQKQVAQMDSTATREVRTCIVAVPDLFTPKRGDTLLFGEVKHEILEAKPFAPGGVVLYFEVTAGT